MFRWTWKSLFNQRGTLIGSALGIACTFILVIFFDAVWRGESIQVVSYPNHMKPDVWVMQSGVGNMHMAMSYVWDWKADKIAEIPGVRKVTPILYMNSVVKTGGHEMFAFIVGLTPNEKRAGPWKLTAGRHIKNSLETVIPDVLSRITNVSIGDKLRITDKSFTIVGLSAETYSSANSVLFVPFSDLEDILSSAGTYSYLLVDAEEGVDPKRLAERIRNNVEKVNALTHEEFIKNDLSMAKQMGVEIIIMMTVISSALAALIVGFTSYSLVIRRRRELAIIKALGMGSVNILISVMIQSAILVLIGFIITVLFSFFVIPYIPLLLPQLTLSISMNAILQLGIIALIVSILGALIPAWLVSRLDPATAFHV
ncbi:MAG: FtsX-like permease family protein [Gammaproteobacteria bacterium]|nr:FtsX-like permease family protein [Gammaproteobacteria bacterium]